MNEYWAPNPQSDEPWLESQALRSLFNTLRVLLVAATLLGAAGGVAYVYVAGLQKEIVLVSGDSRAYRGKPQQLSLAESEFKHLAKDIIESVLLRTKAGDIDALAAKSIRERLAEEMKGSAPEQIEAKVRATLPTRLLDAFVHPEVRPRLDREFNVRSESEYSQIYTVQELRLIEPSPEQIEVHVRGIMASRNLSSAKRNPVFLACVFRPVPPSDKNPLGWMLYGVIRMGESDFFASEIASERKRATTLKGSDQ